MNLTNLSKLLATPLILLLLSTHAYAEGSDGTRGGETETQNGVKRLRDLVDKTICHWKDGEAIIKDYPMIETVLKKVSVVDWYFAADLKQEILKRDYCFTGALVKVNTEDEGSIVTPYYAQRDQAAIRLYNSVYVDENILSQMPDSDIPFLFIHESIHTYIGQGTFMRNLKVKSMVASIEGVYRGRLNTTRSFHSQMENNSVNFPLTSDYLTARKNQVYYLLGDTAVRRELILSATSLTSFFDNIRKLPVQHLKAEHSALIAEATMDSLINSALSEEDTELLDRIVRDSDQAKEKVLLALYASELTQTSEVLKAYLQSLESNGVTVSLVSSLLMRKASFTEDRLIISQVGLIAKEASDEVPFTALNAHDRFSYSNATSQTKIFLKALAKNINEERWDIVGKLTFENPDFYQAMSANSLKDLINTQNFSYPIEKQVALRKVDTLFTGFWIMTSDYVKAQSSQKLWKQFVGRVDQAKLGYEIK